MLRGGRRMFRWACLIGLSIGLVSGAGGARADWFQDPHRQYYVDIPTGWFSNAYQEKSGERVVAFAAADGGTVVRIRAIPATKAIRPEDLRPGFETGVLATATPMTTGAARFGSRKAVVVTYRWTLGDAEYSVATRYVVAEKYGRRTGFIVWRMVPAEGDGQKGAVADRAVGSFSFLRPMEYRRGSGNRDGSGLAAAPPSVRALLGDLAAIESTAPLPSEATSAEPEPSPPPVAASETVVVPALAVPPAEQAPPVLAVAEHTPPTPTVEEPITAVATTPEQTPPAVIPSGGPSECLEATSEGDCGCTMGALQGAFTELEETYFSSMDAAEDMRRTAESLKAGMDAAADGCPKPLYRRAVRLIDNNTDPDVAWAVRRADKVRQCGSLFIARIDERREREPANRTLDSIVEAARVLKYDSLLLLAEFEKVEAARSDARRILRDARATCELIHGPMD